MAAITQQHALRPDSMEEYRNYLTVLARVQVDPRVQRNLDVSGVVQETFLEAHQNWTQFHGKTQPELSAWLRQILAHNLADALRALRRDKRDIARERPLASAIGDSSSKLGNWLA